MTSKEILEKDSKYISNTYRRHPVVLESGKGASAVDISGKAYIDFSSGIGVNALGFCNDAWSQAVAKQAACLQHTSNLFGTLPNIELAEMLCEATGYSRVFFGNSGAEANEGAIKIARKYGINTHGEQCNNIVTLVNSFHGRTVTTLSATGQDVFHKNFFPFTEGFKFVPINDKDALSNAVDNTVCAVMIELVQGEGGVNAADMDYVQYVSTLCKEKNILLIVDEVQTGIGRTGTLLCSEQFNVHPNITTLAKGLGGGLPIGAVLTDELTKDVFTFGDHGSTFGGNPVACAGAIEIIKQVANKEFLTEVNNTAEYLRGELKKLPKVKELSGLGLMIGVTVDESVSAGEIAKKCVENGLLILTAKTKLRLLPPLNITKEEIDKGIEILAKCME